MSLFEPAWKYSGYINTKKGEKALAAASTEKEQPKLAEIATTAPLYQVRIAALNNLQDQSVIAGIARNDSNMDVRICAINKLTDRFILLDIAKGGNPDRIRKSAWSKLIDCGMINYEEYEKSYLLPIVEDSFHRKIYERLSCLREIKTQSLLIEAVKYESTYFQDGYTLVKEAINIAKDLEIKNELTKILKEKENNNSLSPT